MWNSSKINEGELYLILEQEWDSCFDFDIRSVLKDFIKVDIDSWYTRLYIYNCCLIWY